MSEDSKIMTPEGGREGFARHNTESTDAFSSFRQSPPEKSEVMPASLHELLSVIPGL